MPARKKRRGKKRVVIRRPPVLVSRRPLKIAWNEFFAKASTIEDCVVYEPQPPIKLPQEGYKKREEFDALRNAAVEQDSIDSAEENEEEQVFIFNRRLTSKQHMIEVLESRLFEMIEQLKERSDTLSFTNLGSQDTDSMCFGRTARGYHCKLLSITMDKCVRQIQDHFNNEIIKEANILEQNLNQTIKSEEEKVSQLSNELFNLSVSEPEMETDKSSWNVLTFEQLKRLLTRIEAEREMRETKAIPEINIERRKKAIKKRLTRRFARRQIVHLDEFDELRKDIASVRPDKYIDQCVCDLHFDGEETHRPCLATKRMRKLMEILHQKFSYYQWLQLLIQQDYENPDNVF